MEVTTNADAVEPHLYFTILKDSKQSIDADTVQRQLATVAKYLISARDVGQKSLMNQLAFTYSVLIREQQLLAAGFPVFVYQDDVKRFLDKTKTIKIIELERFPRMIPLPQMEEIKRAQALGVFDEFCVVFTDLTGGDYKTDEEKKFVERNRDPVVFGYFRHKQSGIKHDRFYFITDWEDEYCDLTFGKMIEKMSAAGIEKPDHKIATDAAYIQELVTMTLDDMGKRGGGWREALAQTQEALAKQEFTEKSFWERLKTWIAK